MRALDALSVATARRTLLLACLLTGALSASARADECMRLVDVLPSRTFGDGTRTVTLTPPAASLGQWFVTASGNDPGWVEVDGKTVVSPSDLCGPRRDRVTVAVKLRASSKIKVRVPGRCDQLTVRVFGVAPASALPANVGKPVGEVVVLEELLPGGLPARSVRRTVTAPGADGVLFLSAEQAAPVPVLLSGLLWNDEAVLGATVLRPGCQPIVRPVVAHSTNTLETWVLGLPGSRMRVRLRGWVVDTAAPTATWASPSEGAAAGPGTTLRLTWADAGTGVDPSRTKITLNGYDVTSAFALAAGEATAPFAALPASKLVAGTNVLRATVKDRACNAVSAERRFTTGTTPPDTTPPVIAGTPANLTVEQTGPTGAVVTYTAPTATDDRDPAPVVTSVPPSGSTFTAGTTTVTCTATDAAGNTSTATFTVTVRDTTPPVLSGTPANLVVEQTGPVGAVVTFTPPTVTDAADPTAQVVCSPASGSLFPAGTTTVTCTATDAAGNASAPVTFTVTVRDTTAPVLSQVPADQTVEQTGPTGAVVTFTPPTVLDAADPAPVVSCVPTSGSLFPAGTTTVTCTTRDAAGNLASATFQVTVRDRTAPTFTTGVQDFTVEQTGPTGAIVTYTVPVATDAVDGAVTVQCSPAPGTLFPPGYTLVVCTARDKAGNLSAGQFVVHVQDRTLPAIAIGEPAEGVTVGPSTLLRVTYGDAVGVQTPTLAVRVNGDDVTPLLQVLPDAAQARLEDLGLEAGPVLVEVQITDLAGNVGTASRSFTLAIPAVATRLVVEIPPAPGSPLQAGQAYDVTLRALTATGDVAVAFTGVVTFATTDTGSVLNGLVVDFAPEHAGVRTLRGVAQFAAVGPHSVTATTVLGPAIEGQLALVVERSERGRVIAVLPSGAYFPGQTFSARIFVDMGASDGDPATFQDVLGAYDVRLLYDPRQVEIVRVDPGVSSLGAPLFRLPGSVRLMDLNDLGALSAQLGPDPAATGFVEVASIDLFVREDSPGGPLALAVTGDTLTTAVPALDYSFMLSSVGGPGPRPGELEGQVSVVTGRAPAGPVVIGVIPRDGEGLVAGAQTPQDAWAILSAPVDPSTLDAVTLSRDGVAVPGTAHLGDDATEVRFTPAAPLQPGLYTFTVGAGLGALGGAPLGQARVSTFRVGSDPDAVEADLDADGEVAILDLQVRRDVKGGRTQGEVPDFPPVFLSGTGPVEVGTVAGAQVDLEVVDADGGSVALSGTDLPEGARLERSGNNRFSLTIPGVAAGQSIQLQATDAKGETTLVTLITTGKRTNSAPSLLLRRVNLWEQDDVQTRRAAPFRMNEGDLLHFEVEAIDLDFLDPTGADHVAFVPPTLPGVELVSLSGAHGERALYRYQPPFDQEGEREIEFAVHDDEGSHATLRIPVEVEHYDQWPVFEETQDVFFVLAGQTVTLEWIVSDPDGDPVQLAEPELTGSTQLAVVSRVSTPGRLSLTLRILEKNVNTAITVLASDGEVFTYKRMSIVGLEPPPPYEPPPPRLVNYTASFSAPSRFFTNVTLGLSDTSVLDDPETEDVNERNDFGSGAGSFTLVGEFGVHQITELTVSGVGGEVSWNWVSTRFGRVLNVSIQSDTPFGLGKGETRDGTIEVTAGAKHYSLPIVFLSSGLTTVYPPSIPPPPPDPPEPTPVLELVQLSDVIEPTVRVKVRVPKAQFATAFHHSGAALFVSPHPEENPPENPPDRPPTQTGDTVLDLDVYVGGHVTAPIKLQVSYSGVLSEELSIDIPLGSRVPGPPVFATYGPDGALRQVATRAPILPEGMRAEDQSVTPDNPYVVYLAVPRHPKQTMTSRLDAALASGAPSMELPAPVATLGVPLRYTHGAVEDDYTVSLPIFLTFRSVSPASMTPVRVLGDRIVVSMGAPRGGPYIGYGGNYEGANDYFEPAFARPGVVQDALRVEVRSSAGGKPVADASLEVEGFVPGLCGRPLVHYYTLHAENYLLDGAAVWCSDTIEAWDPYLGLSTLHVDDPAFPTPSVLPSIGHPQGDPFTYSVGEHMRKAPGFLPGPNHVHLGRTSTAQPGDLAGTSFDAIFELTTSNRAIPAKTGDGLDVDFTCDGARFGDPTQAAYRQADLMIDDQENPGVAKAGAEVLLATGEEIIHRVDLVVPGVPGRPETDFRLERTYRSQIHYNASFGYGWCSNWFEGLSFPPSGGALPKEVWQTLGREQVASWVLDGHSYKAPPGQYGILQRRPDRTWVLRAPDGLKRTFDATGRLLTIQNRYGDRLEAVYEDRTTRQLDYVLDAYGRKIDFTLEPVEHRETTRDAHYRVRQVEFEGQIIEYLYEHDDLTQVISKSSQTPSQARVEEYTYYAGYPRKGTNVPDYEARDELNHNLKTVTRPADFSAQTPYLTFVYGEAKGYLDYDRVIRETEGGVNASGVPAGGPRIFSYAKRDRTSPLEGDLIVTVTEPNLTTHVHEIDDQRRLTLAVEQRDATRTFRTQMLYDSNDLMIYRRGPQGDWETFSYDEGTRGREKNLLTHVRFASSPVAGQPDLTTKYKYEHVYNQVIEITDARGWSPGFRPDANPSFIGPGRYTTRIFYDYQESIEDIPDVVEFDLKVNVDRGLLDLNSRTEEPLQLWGSPIRVEAPGVHIDPAVRPGAAVQSIVTEVRWNDAGQVESIVDPVGVVTEYAYYSASDPDGDGSPVSPPPVREPRGGGYLQKLTVDSPAASSRRSVSRTALDLSSEFHYDRRGNLTETVDPRRIRTTFEFDIWRGLTRIVKDTADLQLETTNRYDANGWLIETTTGTTTGTTSVPAPVTTKLTRDILGNVVSSTIEGGTKRLVTTFKYDGSSNPIEVKTAKTVVATTYDGRNLPSTVTRGEGSEASTRTFEYDLAGNLVRVEDAADADGDDHNEATTYTYDGFNRLKATTDADGNVEDLTLDPLGHVTQRTFLGLYGTKLAEVSFAYDELGRAYRVQQWAKPGDHSDTAERVTSWVEFDAASRVAFEIAPDRTVVGHHYDGAGRLATTFDGLGNRTDVYYDGAGNPVESHSLEVSPIDQAHPVNVVTKTVFDGVGRPTRLTGPLGMTQTFTYDALGKIREATDAEGPTDGVSTESPNGRGNVRRFEYDPLGRLIKEVRQLRVGGRGPGDGVEPSLPNQGALSHTIQLEYEWDDDSRLAAIVDPKGQRTSFEYDGLSRLRQRTLADGSTYLTFYDKDDNVTATVDPNQTVLRRSYDRLDRLKEIVVVPGQGVVGTKSQNFEYDDLSRMTRAADVSETNGAHPASVEVVQRTYDSLGHLLTEKQNGAELKYSWKPYGRRESLTYPGPQGRVVRSGYDPIGRVISLEDGGQLCRVDWAGPGLRPHRRAVGDRGVGGPVATTTSEYDKALRLTRLAATSTSSPAAPLLDRVYTYNRASQRTSERVVDEGGLQKTYEYDSTYRLTSATTSRAGATLRTANFELDDVGSRVSRTISMDDVASVTTYSTNTVNAYTKVAGTPCTYDRNGNLTDDGTRRYLYDAFDRLVEVRRHTDGPDVLVESYSYLADGRRSRTTVYGSSGSTERRFVYDGDQEVAELDGAGQTVATYVWGPDYVDSLVQYTRGTQTYYVHQDAQFNVVAVTTPEGVLVEKRSYDEYGAMSFSVGGSSGQSAIGLDYGFQGRRHERETGLVYFRARYYDPATGRFISRDLVWDSGNVGNPYTFVGNNPVSGLDPSGELGFLAPLVVWAGMEISAGAFFGGAAAAGFGIYAGREAYVQSQTATSYDYGAIGRAGVGGAVVGLATAVPGGSYLGLASSGIVAQAGDDLARGEASSAGQYAFAAALGPAMRVGFGALGRLGSGAGGTYGGRASGFSRGQGGVAVEQGGARVRQARRLVDEAIDHLGLQARRGDIDVRFARDIDSPVTDVIGGRLVITLDYATLRAKTPKALLTAAHEVVHARQWFQMVDELGDAAALHRWQFRTSYGSRGYALAEIEAETAARAAVAKLLPSHIVQESRNYVAEYVRRYRTRQGW